MKIFLNFNSALLYLFIFTSFTFGSPYESLKSRLGLFYSKFAANIVVENMNSNSIQQGKLLYEYPSKLNFTLTTGEIIASNGFFLWVFNPNNATCIKQDLHDDNSTGGILSILKNSDGSEVNGKYTFTNFARTFSNIIITATDNILQEIQLVYNNGKGYRIRFSNIQKGVSFPASKYNFKPPINSQIIENPINK